VTVVMLDPPKTVPTVPDGMIVRVIYQGRQKVDWKWEDNMGRKVHPEWWNEETGQWQLKPCACTEPYEDERHQPIVAYDGIPYRLECGKDQYMPIEAARAWFGDERSKHEMGTGLNRKGIRAWMNDRQTEVRRLRCIYDNRTGDERTIINHPIVEIYTLDGDRVPMVLDDPLGLESTPATQSVADQQELFRLIAKQQAQLDQLRRQMEAQRNGGPRRRAPEPTPREDDERDEEPVSLHDLPEDPNG
jgi:hypothetical protein